MKIDPWSEFDRSAEKINAALSLRDTFPGPSAQQSYLAMYASARARLVAAGMRDRGSHKSTQQALIGIYSNDRTDQNPGKVLQRHYVYKQLDDYGISSSSTQQQLEPSEAATVMDETIDFIARLRRAVENEMGLRPEIGVQADAKNLHARLEPEISLCAVAASRTCRCPRLQERRDKCCIRRGQARYSPSKRRSHARSGLAEAGLAATLPNAQAALTASSGARLKSRAGAGDRGRWML